MESNAMAPLQHVSPTHCMQRLQKIIFPISSGSTSFPRPYLSLLVLCV